MAEQGERVWTVGGLSRDDDGVWVISKSRELTQSEFGEIQNKCAFVRGLAGQTDLVRLGSAVERLCATLDDARYELESSASLNRRTEAAVPIDLIAVAESAARLEHSLAERIESEEIPRALVDQFHEVRNGLRAKVPVLVVTELALRARSGDLRLTLRDGELSAEGGTHGDLGEIAKGVLGLLCMLSDTHLRAFEGCFARVAAELRREAEGCPDGFPRLISYSVTPSGSEQPQISDFPMEELAALEVFYEQRATAKTPEEIVLAGLALGQSKLRSGLWAGGVDISPGLISGNASEGVAQLPAAKLEIDASLLGSTTLDFWGAIEYGIDRGGDGRTLFSGAVQTSDTVDDCLVVRCEGATNLTEHANFGTLTAELSKEELLRSLLEVAGLSADEFPSIDSSAEQAVEDFEVTLPIHGVRVTETFGLGSIEVVPASSAEQALTGLSDEGEVATRLRAEFSRASGYGRVRVVASSLPMAEEAGLREIDAAVAWLVTRGRYGLARLPDGTVQSFSRQESLRAPRTGSTVLVRGTETGRTWLRSTDLDDVPIERALDSDSAILNPALPADLTVEDHHALLALRRATLAKTSESQLQALWDAVEFIVAKTKLPRLFEPRQLKDLRDLLPDWLGEKQRERVDKAIGDLNSSPLIPRLKWQLEKDGVPLTDAESKLLFVTLRQARNDPSHGRSSQSPSRSDIHHGISIVARMLVYRLADREAT